MGDTKSAYFNMSDVCLSSSNVNLIYACYDCYEALKSSAIIFQFVS